MKLILLCILIANLTCAIPYKNTRGFDSVKHKRETNNAGDSAHVVDLGYEIYEGYTDAITGLNTWKGYVNLKVMSYCCSLANEA